MEHEDSSPNQTTLPSITSGRTERDNNRSPIDSEQTRLISNSSDSKTSNSSESMSDFNELSHLSLDATSPSKKVFCCPGLLTLVGVGLLVAGIIFEAKKVDFDIGKSSQQAENYQSIVSAKVMKKSYPNKNK